MTCLDVIVFIIFVVLFSFLYLAFMIYTLIDFICLVIYILLIFVNFCRCEFINNCKSPVYTLFVSNVVIHHNKLSSQYSPDRKKTFLSNSRPRRPLLKCRKATVAKLNEETCRELRDSFLAWNRVAFETFHCYHPAPSQPTTFLHFTKTNQNRHLSA